MLTIDYVARNKQKGDCYEAENYKELVEKVGKEQALDYANRGWIIAQHTVIRNAGQESKTAKLKKAWAILLAHPEKAQELGIELE